MPDDADTRAVVITEVDDILLMRVNRPRVRNALNRDALRLLVEGYTTLSNSNRLRCGVVCGEGDVFCAGLDLADVMPASIAEGAASYLKPGQCDPFGMYGPPCAKPVITAVHGRCYTAGLELALAADMCVAAKGTLFSQQETTRGIFPLGGATIRLPMAIGWGAAMHCILAGGGFSAEDAHRWGFVQMLTEPGAQLDARWTWLERSPSVRRLPFRRRSPTPGWRRRTAFAPQSSISGPRAGGLHCRPMPARE